jgi:hypothetical protein
MSWSASAAGLVAVAEDMVNEHSFILHDLPRDGKRERDGEPDDPGVQLAPIAITLS